MSNCEICHGVELCGCYPSGITLRQHYVGLTMQGLISRGAYEFHGKDIEGNVLPGIDAEEIVNMAFGLADAMIKHEQGEL